MSTAMASRFLRLSTITNLLIGQRKAMQTINPMVCQLHTMSSRLSSRRQRKQATSRTDVSPSTSTAVKEENNAGIPMQGNELYEYSADELTPGPDMLKRIVSELKTNGFNFILPVHDDEAMQQLAEPLKRLMQQGVKAEFLIDACIKRPDLLTALSLNASASWNVLELLVERCGMTFEDAMRFFVGHIAELLSTSSEEIHRRLDALIECEVGAERAIGRIVNEHPELLYTGDGKKMAVLVENLGGFFSRTDLSEIVRAIPSILLKNFEQLEQKYEYIYYCMGMESKEFLGCLGWVELSLDEVMARHKLLERTGKYTMPDPKRPQLAKENPSLDEILDTPEDEFCTRIAGVTLEEWTVFQALLDQEEIEKDLDRPYERIKPGMRKAIERKMRHKAERESEGDRDRLFDDDE